MRSLDTGDSPSSSEKRLSFALGNGGMRSKGSCACARIDCVAAVPRRPLALSIPGKFPLFINLIDAKLKARTPPAEQSYSPIPRGHTVKVGSDPIDSRGPASNQLPKSKLKLCPDGNSPFGQ